jgi:hypothetical protein
MLPRMPRIAALAAFLSIACLAAPARTVRADQASSRADAPLVLTGLGRATLPIDGPWQFQPGDDLRWASPQFDDSGWASIEVGKTWEEQGYRNLTGFAWYRRHIVLAPGTLGASAFALYLHSTFNPACDSACDVYWNGVLVGGIGKVPPDPVWSFSSSEPSAVVQLGAAQSGVLAIRVWKAPIVFLSFPNEGGLTTIPQAGTSEAVAALQAADEYRWLTGDQFTITVARVSAIGGLLALLFWLRNRQRTVLIWLALVMFDLLEMFYIGFMPFRVFYGLVGVLIGINDMALWLLLIAFLGLSNRTRLVRWTWIFIAAEIALDSVDSIIELFNLYPHFPHACLIADTASTIPAVALEFWGIVLVAAAFRERLDAARWTLAIFALLTDLLQGVADIVTLGLRWTHWTTPGWIHTPLVTLGGSGLDIRTIISTCMLLSIIYVAWRYSVEQTERQVEMEQEFRNARELQQFLIPAALPETPGFAITSAYRPAREVGGDFFQILPLDVAGRAGSALIVLGDVSGKGLKAAMAVSLIVGTLRALAEDHSAPADLLAQLNRRLTGRLQGGFATCAALRIGSDGNCTLASAGHPAPLLNGRELAVPGALPLGITAEAEYSEIEFALAPGDHLALYTDGLLEARGPSGELYGFERVGMLFVARPDAAQAAEAAVRFGQDDDITVLTVKRMGVVDRAPLFAVTASL